MKVYEMEAYCFLFLLLLLKPMILADREVKPPFI